MERQRRLRAIRISFAQRETLVCRTANAIEIVGNVGIELRRTVCDERATVVVVGFAEQRFNCFVVLVYVSAPRYETPALCRSTIPWEMLVV